MKTKQELRKEILYIRDSLTQDERRMKSDRITNRVLSCPEFKDADQYLLFASFRSEVDTSAILKQALASHKPVYLPKVLGTEMKFYQITSLEELEHGYQGIFEPQEAFDKEFVSQPNKRVLVLMPGAVFDREGGRIGYGRGFYDKFLRGLEGEVLPEKLCKLAVAYECQMVKAGEIPRESHDVFPNCIITEEHRIEIW